MTFNTLKGTRLFSRVLFVCGVLKKMWYNDNI